MAQFYRFKLTPNFTPKFLSLLLSLEILFTPYFTPQGVVYGIEKNDDGALVWVKDAENDGTIERTKAYLHKTRKNDGGGEIKGDMFKATHEWQEIKPGHKVPAGLHYRMNLETGKKEAKLLSKNNEYTERDELSERKILLMREMKKALREIEKQEELENELKKTTEEMDTNEKSAGKFRSYEELKKEFQAMNADIRTDLEIIKELMKEYRLVNCSVLRKLQILTELESLLHQIDNAVNFVNSDINGVAVLKEALNNSEEEFRAKAAVLLGSAAQSNPKVQAVVLEDGLLNLLVNLLSIEKRPHVCHKLIFASSSILRRFPVAQKKFLELGGFETLIKILRDRSSDHKIASKVITLIADLLEERREMTALTHDHKINSKNFFEKQRQYDQIPLNRVLLEHEICKLAGGDLLSIDDNYDFQERILRALDQMRQADVCSDEHMSAVVRPNLHNLKSYYEVLLVQEPDDEYITELLDICLKLMKPVVPQQKSRDEL